MRPNPNVPLPSLYPHLLDVFMVNGGEGVSTGFDPPHPQYPDPSNVGHRGTHTNNSYPGQQRSVNSSTVNESLYRSNNPCNTITPSHLHTCNNIIHPIYTLATTIIPSPLHPYNNNYPVLSSFLAFLPYPIYDPDPDPDPPRPLVIFVSLHYG